MEDMSYADVRQHVVEHQLSVLDSTVHGGESQDTIATRCWEALSEVLALTLGPPIAVSHGYAIHALVRHRFGHALGVAQIGNGDVIDVWVDGDAVTGPPMRYPLG